MARILVTGGGGFLGRAIVQQALAQGDQVRVLGRRRYPDLEAVGVECAQGDVSDWEAVKRACQGVEVTYHTAALAGVWGSPLEYDRTNVDGTNAVIAGCRAAGVPRLVYTSTPSVVASPDGTSHEGADESLPYPTKFLADYPRTKVLAEKAVLAANGDALRTVALRPHLLVGAGDPHLLPRVVDRAKKGRLRIIGDGQMKVDVTYVGNAARAHLQAARVLAEKGAPAAGKAYFLSNGEPVVLWPFLNAFLARLGLPPVTKTVSLTGALRLGGALEWCWRTFRLSGEPPMTRFAATMLGTSHWFDISAARRDLGYDPEKVPLTKAMDEVHQWFTEGEGKHHLTGTR